MIKGLSSADAAAIRARIGPNALPERPPDPFWRRFVAQFASPLVYLLLFALVFDLGLWLYEGAESWPIEATAVSVILVLNAALGLYQEQRSEAAMARLRSLAAAQAWVFRDGQLIRVPSSELVPGDVIRLEAGDRVPADGTCVEPKSAMVDESLLTGESVPIDKSDNDEAFSGTLLVRGKTFLTITRTGLSSAMGRLAAMLGGIEASKTPLERRVDHLGHQIAKWVPTLAGVLGVLGILAEGLARAPEMVLFAVALAVAAVPEGLPAVLTVALSMGVERMATLKAVVRRLSAVEALGSVTVIATDKTGTLTENRMDVRAIDAADHARALIAIVLANDADPDTAAGDPLDLGLLRHAVAQGIKPAEVRAAHPTVSERPFDSVWKYTRVTVRGEDGEVSYLKGAPEAIFARCDMTADDRSRWVATADTRASEGYRLIALASGAGETEEHLAFLGLVLLWDPPRPEVPDAVRTAQAAGIRVIMITGDHAATAQAVSQRIGMPASLAITGDRLDELGHDHGSSALRDVNVFARVRPEQKLRIVERLQADGEIVAMTGDGVNDAPALKRSDVGIAMGQRGSDVSREVADLVLLDDNFATLVGAIEEGRGIYENIQKFLRFLFSTNLSEVLVVAVGAVLAYFLDLRNADGHLVLPLTAAQILWINLVTDGLPALALAFDRTPGVMAQPPRPPQSPLLDPPSIRFIVGAGIAKAALALAVLAVVPQMGYSLDTARATAFHVMAVGQLLLTFPSRHTWIHPLPNAYLHVAVLAGLVVQVAASEIPLTARLLGDAAIPAPLWGLVAVAALLAWLLAEGVSRLVWRRRTHE